MDWTNQVHLLQAVLVGLCVLMLVHGYSMGRKE